MAPLSNPGQESRSLHENGGETIGAAAGGKLAHRRSRSAWYLAFAPRLERTVMTTAFDFTVNDIHGEPVELADYRARSC